MSLTAQKFYNAYWVNKDEVSLRDLFIPNAVIHLTNSNTVVTPTGFAKHIGTQKGSVLSFNIPDDGQAAVVIMYLDSLGYPVKIRCRFTYSKDCILGKLLKPIVNPNKWPQNNRGKITKLDFSIDDLQ